MSIDEITAYIGALDGVLTLRPGPGDGSPEISWGDVFFYYAPDGVVPRAQPFATVVTKDYPDDRASRLDRDGAFRLNVAAGADGFRRWTGRDPGEADRAGTDPSTADAVLPHPVYGALGWLCVVNPGPRTAEPVRELVRAAHRAARERHRRRRGEGEAAP
ncbi:MULTISPECIES: DUF6194 family protein [unclassified Nocardiopsis]|uniref:DUF6194 family protein n=1 Tax=unclassified Nocardiopsis TaxID=2649073 RepID=UPI0013587F1F|nr:MULTISPECIES: DUF6194 family protein [unclassified Nocardiopsis]